MSKRDVLHYLLEMMESNGGAEIHKEDWPLVELLIKDNKAKWVSGQRGPGLEWRRAEATRL